MLTIRRERKEEKKDRGCAGDGGPSTERPSSRAPDPDPSLHRKPQAGHTGASWTHGGAKSWHSAMEEALKEASKTLHGISGLDVINTTAVVKDNKITEYRATLKVAFLVEKK